MRHTVKDRLSVDNYTIISMIDIGLGDQRFQQLYNLLYMIKIRPRDERYHAVDE